MKLKTLEILSYRTWFQPVASPADLTAATRNAFHDAVPAEQFAVARPDAASDELCVFQLAKSGPEFGMRLDGGRMSVGPQAMLKMSGASVKSDCGTVFLDEHLALGESYHDPWVFELTTGQPCSHIRANATFDAGSADIPFTAKLYVAPDGPLPVVPGPYVSLVSRWADNYAHWLLEVLPRLWYRDAYPELCGLPILVPALTRPFQRETLEALGVAGQCVPYADAFVRFERLYFPTFIAPGGYAPRQVRWLRDTLGAAFGVLPAERPGRRLFVSRQNARGRHLLNYDAVEQHLQARGFETVLLETLSVREQVAMFAEAAVVVAPHGAGIANLVFLPEGSAFVELQPRSVSHPIAWVLSKAAGCRYGVVFCHDSGSPLCNMDVDVAALAGVLDTLEAD